MAKKNRSRHRSRRRANLPPHRSKAATKQPQGAKASQPIQIALDQESITRILREGLQNAQPGQDPADFMQNLGGALSGVVASLTQGLQASLAAQVAAQHPGIDPQILTSAILEQGFRPKAPDPTHPAATTTAANATPSPAPKDTADDPHLAATPDAPPAAPATDTVGSHTTSVTPAAAGPAPVDPQDEPGQPPPTVDDSAAAATATPRFEQRLGSEMRQAFDHYAAAHGLPSAQDLSEAVQPDAMRSHATGLLNSLLGAVVRALAPPAQAGAADGESAVPPSPPAELSQRLHNIDVAGAFAKLLELRRRQGTAQDAGASDPEVEGADSPAAAAPPSETPPTATDAEDA